MNGRECSTATPSFIRNHHVPEDLPCPVRLLLPSCQIPFNQSFASAECGLSLAPFIDKASLFRRSPRLHCGGAGSSKAFELRCHVPLDLKPPSNTLPCSTAIDRIFGICCGDPRHVSSLYPVDPGVVSGINRDPCRGRRRLARHEHRCRNQANRRDERPECFHRRNLLSQTCTYKRSSSPRRTVWPGAESGIR
jgi:hypothetical protein